MKQTTSIRTQRAAVALKLDRLNAELVAQRALFENVIVLLDKHEWQLANYRAISPLFGK